MILIIDNYDSFTYNLYQIFVGAGFDAQVKYNDAVDLAGLKKIKPSHLVVSPGPGTPSAAGISLTALGYFSGRIPVLGVCLGHQALAQAFGAHIVRAAHPMHGKTSLIHHDGRGVFAGMPETFCAMRYHSLLVEKEKLPPCFDISGWTADGEIMGLRHKNSGAEGVQFHPESILSQEGEHLLLNFVRGGA